MYPFRVLASGSTMRGRAFTREHLLTGAVWTGGDHPPPTTTDDPQTSKDQICQLLSCLLSEKVIRPEFAERLLAAGLDLNTARKCLERWRRTRRSARPGDR